MRKSIFFTIFITCMVLILLLSTSIFYVATRLIRTQYLNTEIESLSRISEILSKTLKSLIEQGKWTELDLFIKDITEKTDIRITVIDPEGKVLAESFRNFQEMENHRERPEFKAALQGEKSNIVRYSSTMKEDMLYIASPISMEGDIGAVLRLAIFLDELHSIINQFRHRILLLVFIMLLISLGISTVIFRRQTMLLREMVDAFGKVGSGNFDTQILSYQRKSEIKGLIDGFNRMTEKINELFKRLSQQTEELNNVIAKMESGIALLDGKGRIILSNDHFRKIFSSQQSSPKYFWELIRDEQLIQHINLLIEEKNNFSKKFELLEKYYQCTGTYTGSEDKRLLVFHDITPSETLSQVKKDLISNISHELHTPLTSIKGYIETIESSEEISESERKRYMQIIKRNTERLINIVNDLQILSELEARKENLQIEKINLQEMLENLKRLFELRMNEKRLGFNLAIDQDLPPLEADVYKIEQMLINLIDNAIKYTKEGEITLSVRSLPANKITIEVIDTGIGIKQEEINRIFERFYVVNKARSRQQGGTGLGLSIVKHIVLLHKGEIEVHSQIGMGSRITIILPIRQP